MPSGKSVNHAEDRVCSTAVAVNALLYTWTANQKLNPSTPTDVGDTIVKACKWLLKNSLGGKYKSFNVLFSGSVKLEAVSPLQINMICLYNTLWSKVSD